MSLVISSTTDSQEAVNAAAGIAPPEPEQEVTETAQRPPKAPPEPETDPDEDEYEEGDDLPPAEEEKAPPPKKVGGFQRKIQKLEQEKDYVYRRLMALEEQVRTNGHAQQQPPQQQQRPSGEPKSTDFTDYDEYNSALIDYRVAQKVEALERQRQQQQLAAQREEQVNGWRTRVGQFKSEAHDFDDVLANVDHIEIPPFLQQALIEDDLGPKLAYELARNPDEFEKIAGLTSPLAALKAIGEFKARITAKAVPPRRPVSQAPEPIRPVAANGAGATVSTKPLDQMSYQDYKRARNRQIAARKNGS